MKQNARLIPHGAAPLVADPFSTETEDAVFAHVEELPALKKVSNLLIAEAMRRAKGNQSIAARFLGTTRSAINKHLHQKPSRP